MKARKERGFMLLSVLLVVAIVAVVSAASLRLGERVYRASAEQDLYHIGLAYEAALASYQSHSADRITGPQTMEELLWDTRNSAGYRHLRRIYHDPLTGQASWGFIRDANDRILGIYSLAPGTPIKQDNFDVEHDKFSSASTYAQWIFYGR